MENERKSFLFVCYANIDRSRTAEDVCRTMAEENHLELEVTSAGVASYATRQVSKELADEADLIFVMEDYMTEQLVQFYGQDPAKVVCLNITDSYKRGDPKLVSLLRDALRPYLPGTTQPSASA